MPGKNLVKSYAPDSFYHVYNRGVNKQHIFNDSDDYVVFLALLKRYIGDKPEKRQNRSNHPNYYNDLDLLAFCLMPNHFHLMIHQGEDPRAITDFMRSLSTAYSMYFNRKYKRVGPLFQQRYRAVMVDNDSYLLHISRYIHLNPADYMNYEWSSLPYYLTTKSASWVKPGRVLDLFDGDYATFLRDYEDTKAELGALKYLLAEIDT